MKVVFLAEVQGSGRIGEVKEVADGFARNYLLPRKLAAVATPDAVRRAEARAAAEARRQAALDEEARLLMEKIGLAAITLEVRAGERGRLYGSVTAADIAEEVTRLTGSEFDRHLVRLEEPIKELGSYEVPLRLTRNVEASLQVEVVAAGGAEAEAPPVASEAAPAEEDVAETEAVAGEESPEAEEEPVAEEESADADEET